MKLLFGFIIFLLLFCYSESQSNFVTNGDFEFSNYDLTPWSSNGDWSTGWQLLGYPGNVYAHNSATSVETQCQTSCIPLTQTINGLTTGAIYIFSFYLLSNTATSTCGVQIGGTTLFGSIQNPMGPSWFFYSTSFAATGFSMLLRFSCVVPATKYVAVDDVVLVLQAPTLFPTRQPTAEPTQPTPSPTYVPSRLPTSQPSGHPTSQPIVKPSSKPTSQPSRQPSSQPVSRPSRQPTNLPSSQPTHFPTNQPSSHPTRKPTTQPSSHPSSQPSSRPSMQPTHFPSSRPSRQPTSQPTSCPSSQPNSVPTSQPTSLPTRRPSMQPTSQPSRRPSSQPSRLPTNQPSSRPTSQPTLSPSSQPSRRPTGQPSRQPTSQPFGRPSSQPSARPTRQPSRAPSSQPTREPTDQPSSVPSSQPSEQPSAQPSVHPSSQPSQTPSTQPSAQPTALPSAQPTKVPSEQPTSIPSTVPSTQPTSVPTSQPSSLPSSQPSVCPTLQPSSQPSAQPTLRPSGFPSAQPTLLPTAQPSSQPSGQPSAFPTSQPSSTPSMQPSGQPSSLPSIQPSSRPSRQPSGIPTNRPTTQPTAFPSSQPSLQPSQQPSNRPSSQPTSFPSNQPSRAPSSQPSLVPTVQPTSIPSNQPSASPTSQPTVLPTTQPSVVPSSVPSSQPSEFPSAFPSSQPSNQPVAHPSRCPSGQPSGLPSSQPSLQPVSNPSNQPTTIPSKQPNSSPTSRPTEQPTTIPSVQPSSFPTAPPVVNIYLTKGVLFFPGDPLYSFQQTADKTDELLGSSYILFGRKNYHQDEKQFPITFSLESTDSKAFVSLLNDSVAGISSDTVTRATTVIGDINNDGFLDLMIGLPLDSTCVVYLGTSFGIVEGRESFRLIGDSEDGGGQLGWAATRFGDLNHDGFDEIVVSAPYANIVYFIYGKIDFDEDIFVRNLLPKDGFRIIGSKEDTNFGVALSLIHDFNKDGFQDLAITAVRPGGANVIYILLGNVVFGSEDFQIDQFLVRNSSSCFRIFAPYLSYAGFSIAGIGDINSDGYNDLTIGSIPINSAHYGSQKTYFIYGREVTARTDFYLSEMTQKDGFIVTDGGFLVLSAGDVNGDGISDVMITSYYQWKGKGNAYLITYPKNVTYSPTFEPSPAPSTLFPSSAPSLLLSTFYPTVSSSSSSNSSIETDSPTVVSSMKPSPVPSLRPSFSSKPTVMPTADPTRKPSPIPTAIRPAHTVIPIATPAPTQLRLRSRNPTPLPTREATPLNTTVYTEVDCAEAGEYHGKNATNYKFIIRAQNGTVQITGNALTGAKNVFVLFCPQDRVDVVITNFRLSTDLISVVHLSEAGYFYPSLSDIPYHSSSNDLVTLLFGAENKLQVILSSHTTFNLQENNFLFSLMGTDENEQFSSATILATVEIGVIAGVLIFLGLIFGALAYQDRKEEKAKLIFEEKWLSYSLLVSSEEGEVSLIPIDSSLHRKPAEHKILSDRSSSCPSSSSRSSSYCSAENPESVPFEEFPGKKGNILVVSGEKEPIEADENETDDLFSINSDEWRHALSDDDDDYNNNCEEQQYQQAHNRSDLVISEQIKTRPLPLENALHNSQSLSSSSEEGSISFTQFSFESPPVIDTGGDDEDYNLDEMSNSNDDIMNSINSDDWLHALASSGDEESWKL
jgi:hypothetical protein